MDKKKFKPLVSIIIPVFNGDKYLFDSLSSVIHQSYDNIEIIIIDDGSYKNNQYRPILKKFKNQNIRFLKRRKNAGVSKVMNLAIKKSKGEYVNWLSHDDIIHPLKIEKQINLIRQYPNKKILCFSHSISFNENSSYERKIKINKNLIRKSNWLLTSDKLHGCSMLIPKKYIVSAGYFNESLRYTQDYDMWMKLHDMGVKFLLCDEYLLFSRKHELQDTIFFSEKVDLEKKNFYFNKLIDYFDKNNFKQFFIIDTFIIFFSFIYRGYNPIITYFLINYKKSFLIKKFSMYFIFTIASIVAYPIFVSKKLLLDFLIKFIFKFKY